MHTKSNKFTKPGGSHYNLLTEKIAIDYEMMQSNIGQALGRVSIVNYEGETIFDAFVCQPQPINIIRSMIGHDIQKDLKVIAIDLPSHILLLQGATWRLTPVTFDMRVRDTEK